MSVGGLRVSVGDHRAPPLRGQVICFCCIFTTWNVQCPYPGDTKVHFATSFTKQAELRTKWNCWLCVISHKHHFFVSFLSYIVTCCASVRGGKVISWKKTWNVFSDHIHCIICLKEISSTKVKKLVYVGCKNENIFPLTDTRTKLTFWASAHATAVLLYKQYTVSPKDLAKLSGCWVIACGYLTAENDLPVYLLMT